MNIFAVDYDAFKAAQDLCDKHVVKMVLETAQLLCTAHRVLDGVKAGKTYIHQDPDLNNFLYKATHINHPCSIWVRKSPENYQWLSIHFQALLLEYENRYQKIHNCIKLLPILIKTPNSIPWVNKSNNKDYNAYYQFPLAMPDGYKNPECAVNSYRRYYVFDKVVGGIAQWNKSRSRPEWVDEFLQSEKMGWDLR